MSNIIAGLGTENRLAKDFSCCIRGFSLDLALHSRVLHSSNNGIIENEISSAICKSNGKFCRM